MNNLDYNKEVTYVLHNLYANKPTKIPEHILIKRFVHKYNGIKNIKKEYDLIQQKKSKLPASERRALVNFILKSGENNENNS